MKVLYGVRVVAVLLMILVIVVLHRWMGRLGQ
jgi:hypothetical protein